jgi:tetratricopeptide (TPR) repeat protein
MALAAGKRWNEARAALDSVKAAAGAVTQFPGGPVLRIAERALAGEIAARRGEREEAIAKLTEAMRMEGELTYMEPPYWHRPVRHMLGAVLLDAGRARESERLYKEDLERFPENVWSLRGMERSLAAQGRNTEARQVRERFERAAQQADVTLTSSAF